MQEAAESEVQMKNWTLKDKKYYKKWSEYIRYFMNIGHDNSTAQLLATEKIKNEEKA